MCKCMYTILSKLHDVRHDQKKEENVHNGCGCSRNGSLKMLERQTHQVYVVHRRVHGTERNICMYIGWNKKGKT